MCQENNENYRLMRLCSILTRPEHASSTPRKSRNCCGWVSLARCHKVARNATSNTKAYFEGNVCLVAAQVEMQNQNIVT